MIRAFSLALALSLLTGCANNKQRLSLQSSRAFKPSDYSGVLERWTRYDSVFEALDSIIFVHATFHAPEFRRAFLVRHPEVYGPGSEEASRLLLTKPESEQFHEFFLSTSTSDIRWNDLDKEDSIWRVTLQGDKGSRVDGEVVRIKTSANIRVIYPHITDFARTYAVRFPLSVEGKPVISSATERFVLRITSALGEAEMTWRLTPGAVARLN